jgi:hypothetical protein
VVAAGIVLTTILTAGATHFAPKVLDGVKEVAGGDSVAVSASGDYVLTPGDTWVMGSAWNAEPPALDGSEADWYESHGAVQAGYSGNRVGIENLRSGPVDILAARAVIEQRLPPLTGTLFSLPPEGEVGDVALWIDLDAADPVAFELTGAENPDAHSRAPYFATRHIQLIEKDRVYFRVLARTRKCYCRWRLRIDYRQNGKVAALTVPGAAEPAFQTTAFASSYSRVFTFDFDRTPPGFRPVDPAAHCAGDGECS